MKGATLFGEVVWFFQRYIIAVFVFGWESPRGIDFDLYPSHIRGTSLPRLSGESIAFSLAELL